MCGIVGYCGNKNAVDVLLNGLKCLEYRGYDSSGIAVANGSNLTIIKRAGRISVLEECVAARQVCGSCGIGHTRWATHGNATDCNAHPFSAGYSKFAVVHNGIITNYAALAKRLAECGIMCVSDTDSEVIAHLIDFYYTGDIFAALRRTAAELNGSFALGVISVYEPNAVYGVRKDSPLVVGKGSDGYYLCSDSASMGEFCREFAELGSGEIVKITADSAVAENFDGKSVPLVFADAKGDVFDAYYGKTSKMLSEIRQVPEVLEACETAYEENDYSRFAADVTGGITVVGCGSAYHAGLAFCRAMKELGGVTVNVEIASEYVTSAHCGKGGLVIAVSQSGETADTLLAARQAKQAGNKVICVCNCAASSLVKLCDGAMITVCGRECAVAATKSYVAQVWYLLRFALDVLKSMGRLCDAEFAEYCVGLGGLPSLCRKVLDGEEYIGEACRNFNPTAMFFLGRKWDYDAAMEGSLKLKEVSYVFSEAYPAGELKHGTLALMEKGVYVVCVGCDAALADKNEASMAEVKCRGASVVYITCESTAKNLTSGVADYVFTVPDAAVPFCPVLSAVVMQLLAYFMAKYRGCDVDRPRNLAKSVTVE